MRPAFLRDGSDHYNKMRRIHPRDAISKLDYYLPTTPSISSISSPSSSAETNCSSDNATSSSFSASASASASSSSSSKRFLAVEINLKRGQDRPQAESSFVRKRKGLASSASTGSGKSKSAGDSPFQTSGFSDGTLIAEPTVREDFRPPAGIASLQDRNHHYLIDGRQQQQAHELASGRKKSRIVHIEDLIRRSSAASGLPPLAAKSGGAKLTPAAAMQFLNLHYFHRQRAAAAGGGAARLKRRNIKRINRRMLNKDGTADLQLADDEYALSELFSQSEIPGFREIFASDSYLRKFCWIVAFLFMTVLSLNDMTELITEYFEYPITVDVRLTDSARLPFPAVTVCNLNVVRSSALCSSSSRSDLANQIPSELREKLCGLPVDKKNNSGGPDSDIADINSIGITTTTTTSTTTSSTTTSTSGSSSTSPTATSAPAPEAPNDGDADDLGQPGSLASTRSPLSPPPPSANQTQSPNDGGGGDDDAADQLESGRPSPGGSRAGGQKIQATSSSGDYGALPAATTASPLPLTTSRTKGSGGGGLDLGSDFYEKRASGARRVGVDVVAVDTSGRMRGDADLARRPSRRKSRRSIKLTDSQQDGQVQRPFASSQSRVHVWTAQQQDSQRRLSPQGTNQASRVKAGQLGGPNRAGGSQLGLALQPSHGMGRPGPINSPPVSVGSHQNPLLGGGTFMPTGPPPPGSAATTSQSAGGNAAGGGHQIGQQPGGSGAPAPPEDFELTERQERELQENLTNWLAVMYNRDPQLTRSLGHQFDDMILRCTMKSINCTHQRSFENSFTPTEGNCFTYRSKIRRRLPPTTSGLAPARSGTSFEEANLAGTSHGLELVLNLEKNEYISGSSQVGALVMIHHPSDLGYAASEATFVAPEYTTYIGLKMVNLTRLPAPYPEYCVDSWPSKFADTLIRNSTYSQQACLKICLQKTIQSHCQCQSAFLPIVELESNQFHSSSGSGSDTNSTANQDTQHRIIICDTRKLATRQCVRDVMFRAADRVHNCECPPKCQVVRYDKTISMARWPTREDRVSFDRGKMDVNFQNLAKVIVYFQTMTCDEITQQKVFTAAKLFSALGGIMGMYVGFSFLSVFEIFEVMSRKMWHHFMVRLARASCRFSGGRFRA